MRKVLIGLMSAVLITLIACSNEEQVKPEDRLKEYVDYWLAKDFESMYAMISDTEKEEFVDRYQKIYGDLEVSELEIEYEVPQTEEDEELDLEEIDKMSFPLHVSMETIAGPISFDTNMEMVKEIKTVEDEEQMDWLVNWHPGFIFPELKDGGTIGITSTEPSRGQIFDRNNEGLAVNEEIYQMGIVPERFTDEEAEKEEIAEVLGISVEEIDQALSADWVEPHLFVPLKIVPTLSENGLEEAVDSISAFTYRPTVGRIYPLGEAAAHLVGYIAPVTAEKLEDLDENIYSANDMIGNRGLEELFEDRLRGERGVQIYAEKEGADPVVLAEKDVKNGEDITLTIDATVQQETFQAFGDDAGTATAIHPTTGETLALVSSPSFDPNAFVYGLSNDQWKGWQDDPKQPLLNRFTATFAPGSAFKPITSTIGLENGTIDPAEGLTINGLTWQKDNWGNYSVRRVSESAGPVDLNDALVRSDNIYFAMQAINMGEEAFISGLKEFGFTEDVPFTYPIEASTISNDGTLNSEVLLADTSYGQGQLEMSGLHLATSFSIFLNDGNLIQPTLLLEEEKGQNWKERVISEENAAIIREALRGVVTDGTGGNAEVQGLAISGKTGTAELKQSLDEEGAAENGWFVGYPEDESLVIAMMVENIENQSAGSGYVAEKVGNVFAEIN